MTDPQPPHRQGFSLPAALATLLFTAVIVVLWSIKHGAYQPASAQIEDMQELRAELAKREDSAGDLRIPTGLFVQSLRFEETTSVRVTGYVWQR